MGQAISSFIQGQTDDAKKIADDALNSLQALAETKMQNFYQTIENSASDNLLLPIKRITARSDFYMAKASTDESGLEKQIGDLIGDLGEGKWADAIAKGAADILTDLLGSSNASVQEKQSYSISVNPLGGVQRIDTYFFAYTFTSQALSSSAQNMVASMVVKSSVNCAQMDDNTLRVIVNDSFPTLDTATVVKLYEDLASIILPAPPTEAQIAATNDLEQLYLSQTPAVQAAAEAAAKAADARKATQKQALPPSTNAQANPTS